MLLSDVHCQFHLINQQIEAAEKKYGNAISQVIVLGDLGFFPDEIKYFFNKNPDGFCRPLAFIDGNHEDFAELPDLAAKFAGRLTYLPRATLKIFDSFKMLALGGAAYMDAAITPSGSEITAWQIQACLDYSPGSVDVVLTHDCPKNIGILNHRGFEHYGEPGFDGGLEIARHLKPKLWFFGHHHRWFERIIDNTRFIGIAEAWKGYALLLADGRVIIEKNEIKRKLSWWQRFWFGSE